MLATTSVKKQMTQFSKKDVRRAELARQLQNCAGPMSLDEYISAVSTVHIQICPVAPTYIKIAEII